MQAIQNKSQRVGYTWGRTALIVTNIILTTIIIGMIIFAAVNFKKIVNKVVEIAAVPPAVTTAAIPPSIDANLCSKTSFVGLFNLVYI